MISPAGGKRAYCRGERLIMMPWRKVLRATQQIPVMIVSDAAANPAHRVGSFPAYLGGGGGSVGAELLANRRYLPHLSRRRVGASSHSAGDACADSHGSHAAEKAAGH